MFTKHTIHEMGQIGVYKITNLITSKVYIGSTVYQFKTRFWHHRGSLRRGNGVPILQRSVDKHGLANFEVTILEVMIDSNSIRDREQYWIDQYNSAHADCGYNYMDQVDNLNSPIARRRHSKRFLLVSPDDVQISTWGLDLCCRQLGIDAIGMRRLAKGEYRHWKGWQCYEYGQIPDIIPQATDFMHAALLDVTNGYAKRKKPRGRAYIVFDPERNRYETENLGIFCHERGLGYSSMRRVAVGQALFHKDWLCYHADKVPDVIQSVQELRKIYHEKLVIASQKGVAARHTSIIN